MRLNEVSFTGVRPIDGYGPGFFRVGGQVFQGALLVLPGGPQGWSGFGDTGALLAAADAVDVLLVGTGPEIAPVPAAFRTALEDAGIGVEAMPSPPACRTFNVLLGEGRRVAAALLPV